MDGIVFVCSVQNWMGLMPLLRAGRLEKSGLEKANFLGFDLGVRSRPWDMEPDDLDGQF